MEAANFTSSHLVQHSYFQFEEGKQYIYEAQTKAGPALQIVKLSGQCKWIAGVYCATVIQQNWLEGQHQSTARYYFAQADDGTVWYLSAEVNLVHGQTLVSPADGSWEHEIAGASAGK